MYRTTAVYAGSFDPVTLGHADLIHRAANNLGIDRLIVAIGVNPAKKSLFSEEERIEMIKTTIEGNISNSKTEVRAFKEKLLVQFCQENQASIIIRGLRALSDFEYELSIAHANKTQFQWIDTVFLPTKPEFSFVSSSTVKELARYGGKLEQYVHPYVAECLRKKFNQPG